MEGLRVVELAGSWARGRGWPAGLDRRHVLVRYAAPAAFLLAVTGVALAIRAGVRSDAAPAKAPAAVTRSGASSAAAHRKAAPPKRWYVIQSGDTLGAIAARFGTSVDSLLRLNPGIEPTALLPGMHVRLQ
jgi:Tfp pilus assembly protein FimV